VNQRDGAWTGEIELTEEREPGPRAPHPRTAVGSLAPPRSASSPRRRSPPSLATHCASRRCRPPLRQTPTAPATLRHPRVLAAARQRGAGGERGGRRRRRASGPVAAGVSGEKEAESRGAPIGLGFSPGRLFIWTQ
jgi:hypothetical protein